MPSLLQRISLIVSALGLAACAAAPQLPVAMKATAIEPDAGRIGIMATKVPEPDSAFPGASCLLCLAAANLNHTTLKGHIATLSSDDLKRISPDLQAELQRLGADVVVIDQAFDASQWPDNATKEPGFSPKDLRAAAARYDIGRLLVVELNAVGIHRSYSAYVPVAPPAAVVYGMSFLVDLRNNAYDWYYPIRFQQQAEGEWDEPPSFPGLTNAYYGAIERTRDELVRQMSLRDAAPVATPAGSPPATTTPAASTPTTTTPTTTTPTATAPAATTPAIGESASPSGTTPR